MKRSTTRIGSVLITIGLTIATGALAQYAPAPEAKQQAQFARLAIAPRAMNFGVARKVETKFVRLKNTGNLAANVTVIQPSSPEFTLTEGGGSYQMTPAQVMKIGVQFAPTAAGLVRDQMTIQCNNCNTAADQNVVIKLVGNARGAVATATATSGATPTATATPGPNANALPFQVTSGSFNTVDTPYASVTICAHGTLNCATVNDVLIDTASFGLRVFASQIKGLGITPNSDGNSEVGECAFFGAGFTWGGVSTVDVQLAGEPTIAIPIQVIDDTGSFGQAPAECSQGFPQLSSPDTAGFNGLMGLGQIANDAVTVGGTTIFTAYFDCSQGSCSALNSPPASDAVANPVAAMPTDNNGVVVNLPSIPADGAATTNGTLYFGIGTESDNKPAVGVKPYTSNNNPNSLDYLTIDTTYKGVTSGGSIFDTGSNGYFFNDSSITQCSDGSGFYCPPATLNESATNKGLNGKSGLVHFSIANADGLSSTDAAFDDLGGTNDGGAKFDGFDWGLPFFFGRNVYVGIAGTKSSLGTGPYTAY